MVRQSLPPWPVYTAATLLAEPRPLVTSGAGQRLAKARVGQDQVMIHLEQYQLIPQAHFALAERIDPAPDRRHPLTNVKIKPFDKGRVDGASHSSPEAARWPAGSRRPRGVDPPRHRRRYDFTPAPSAARAAASTAASVLALWPGAVGVHPLATMGQQRRGVVLEAIGQKQRYAVRRQHLGHLMHHALGPSPGCDCRHRPRPAVCSEAPSPSTPRRGSVPGAGSPRPR